MFPALERSVHVSADRLRLLGFGVSFVPVLAAASRGGDVFRGGQLCFEVGHAPVLEAQVGAGGLEPLVEGAVVGG